MKTKPKSWIWKLTFPFAHDNYTVVFGTIYYPKNRPPSKTIIKHESIHEQQAKSVGGWIPFYCLYLFCLPLLFNPFRKKWEAEAYKKANKYNDEKIKKILSSSMYGWLIM